MIKSGYNDPSKYKCWKLFRATLSDVVFRTVRYGAYGHKIDGIYARAFAEQTRRPLIYRVVLDHFIYFIYLFIYYFQFPASNYCYMNSPFFVDP